MIDMLEISNWFCRVLSQNSKSKFGPCRCNFVSILKILKLGPWSTNFWALKARIFRMKWKWSHKSKYSCPSFGTELPKTGRSELAWHIFLNCTIWEIYCIQIVFTKNNIKMCKSKLGEIVLEFFFSVSQGIFFAIKTLKIFKKIKNLPRI